MSFEEQISQPQAGSSIAERLKNAQDLLMNAKKSAIESKKSNVTAKKKEALEIAGASKDQSGKYENLASDAGSYDELKDIHFEVFFTALARDLNKKEGDYLSFVQNRKDVEDLKKGIANFDDLSDEYKNEEMQQEFESLRVFATELMRQWAKILSEWFAEQAVFYQEKVSEADVEALTLEPLLTAEVRMVDETFESISYRTMRKYSDNLAEKTHISLLHGLSKFETDSDLSSETINQLRMCQFDYPKIAEFYAKIKQIVSLGISPDSESFNTLHSNFSHYLAGRNNNLKEKVLVDFKKLVVKVDAIERSSEALRYYTEQQMRGAIDIITNTFKTDEQRQDALSFVQMFDHKTHLTSHMHGPSPFRNNFSVGDYGEDQIPDWLTEVYKKFNNIHLFNALLKADIVNIHSWINEGQILRAISKQSAYGNPEVEKGLYDNIEFTRSEQDIYVKAPFIDLEVEKDDLSTGRTSKFSKATLDSEMIALVESVWKNLEKGSVTVNKQDIKHARSVLSVCSIQGVVYKQERYERGLREVAHITASSLNKDVQNFENTVDMRLAAVKPTTFERLSQRAKKDGVIQINSIADGVEVIGAMQDLVERYLSHDRPLLEGALSKAGEEVVRAKGREEVSMLTLQSRIADAIRPHQDAAEKNRESVNALAGQLLHVQNEYVEMKNHLEGQVRDLTARNLTYSAEVDGLRTQFNAAKLKSDSAREDLLSGIHSALREVAIMDAGFMGGDGVRYKKLKELLAALR